MLTTVQDIINQIYWLLGLKSIAAAETPTSAESTVALSILNMVLDDWSTERLLLQAMIQESFALTSGTNSYTIGSGGVFNTVIPLRIENAFYRDQTNTDYPVRIISQETYDTYGDKETASGPPVAIFFNPGIAQQASRLGTIFVYPVPDNSSTYNLYIESQKLLTEFAATTDSLTFPAQYQTALIHSAAVRLASYYGIQLDQMIVSTGATAYLNLLRINRVRIESQTHLPSNRGGRGNIYNFE